VWMDDRLSSLPPYPSGPELPPARPSCGRVLSQVVCGLGGAFLGFLAGAFGCAGLGAGDAWGDALDVLGMVALLVGVAGAALGGWVGARLG
jgi:hypothetical protein